jgi:hypothetical protein
MVHGRVLLVSGGKETIASLPVRGRGGRQRRLPSPAGFQYTSNASGRQRWGQEKEEPLALCGSLLRETGSKKLVKSVPRITTRFPRQSERRQPNVSIFATTTGLSRGLDAVYQATLAELQRNEALRRTIGIEKEADVPQSWNISRFLDTLGQEPHRSELRRVFDAMVQRLGAAVSGFGKDQTEQMLPGHYG